MSDTDTLPPSCRRPYERAQTAVILRRLGYRPLALARTLGLDRAEWSMHLNIDAPIRESEAQKVADHVGLRLLDLFLAELLTDEQDAPARTNQEVADLVLKGHNHDITS